jgi:pimeloyl-ACP methyl ester carboxylesterase
MRPKSSGHVDVGALELYHERHGQGPPLVLLHGAFGTIESCFADLLPALATDFEVVAVELQGHGRTRDIARPLSYEQMAADVAALVEALEIPRAHLVGYSMGGAVGLQLALDHPELVDRLVFAGGADFDRAASTPRPRRTSSRSTHTSSTDLDGTRRTAESRPLRTPGHRSS